MRSQGTLEYIVLLSGIIIVVLMVIDALLKMAQTSAYEVNENMSYAYSVLKNYVKNLKI